MISTPTVQSEQDTTEALLRRHEGLVVKIVRKYAEPGTERFDDLKQAGDIALWQANESFDPKRGMFSTWAWPWIFNAVSHEAAHDYVIRTPRINPGHSRENCLLKLKARATLSVHEPPEDDALFDSAPGPGAAIERADSLRVSEARLERMLSILSPQSARVVRRRLEGALFREIAVEMGVTKQWANYCWRRSLAILRGTAKAMATEVDE